ncbi:UDP-glycosyltransferase [Gramella sp. KN1008]|uniref:UDP-glycosyltransferase n=1 Tax=Gramella sp. KN1008 TaxID=2529298 RepID=UPI0010408222|nr:UDP-glycosyltransferase [Gramella sp. KN1008]TBW25579.1 UDP-glycosyltransferase [Gramella sp. KN1008]
MPPKRKILVVVESIDVDGSSGAKANVAFINNLHEAGFDLSVYHYSQKNIRLKGIECTEIRENRRSFLFFLSRLERYIRYFFKIEPNKQLEKFFGFSFTLFNDRNSIVSKLKKSNETNSELIITLSQAGSFRPHHALLKLPELHQKWLAYIHDPYPMHLYPRPFAWVEPGYRKKWELIRDISEKAAFSAFPSLLLKDWMASYYPKFTDTGYIIPHQVFEIEVDNDSLPEYFNSKHFNLMHAGSLLKPRNPKVLVESFEAFLNRNPEAEKDSRLILVGGRSVFSNWLNKKKSVLDQLILVEEKLPFNYVHSLQSYSSVNIILEAKSEISPFLPGKFPHCIQADKPILYLGPVLSESNRLLGENYPYSTSIDDKEGITNMIEELYYRWKKASGVLSLDRPDLKKYLGPEYLKDEINKIFNSLGQKL